MIKLILIGGGGHCRSCIDVIEATNNYRIIGILDPVMKKGEKLLGYEVLGDDSLISKYCGNDVEFLITIGQIATHEIRENIFRDVKSSSGKFATIVSPRAYISSHSSVGEGTIVMHDALINVGVTVKENCIINTKALIEHDCKIESHCHVSTAAVINGGCTISEGTFFGSNSVSKQGVSTKKYDFVKAGRCFIGAKD